MKNNKLILISFIQSFGLAFYCFLVGWIIFNKAEQWFGEMNETLGSMMFLMIFVLSVLICGLITFGYPVKLFLETKKWSESLKLVIYTVGWLLFFVILVGLVIIP